MENYKKLLNELNEFYKKAPKYVPIKWEINKLKTSEYLILKNIYWINERIIKIINKYSESYYMEVKMTRIRISIRLPYLKEEREGQ